MLLVDQLSSEKRSCKKRWAALVSMACDRLSSRRDDVKKYTENPFTAVSFTNKSTV